MARQTRSEVAPAGALSVRRGSDGRYKNVGNRVASPFHFHHRVDDLFVWSLGAGPIPALGRKQQAMPSFEQQTVEVEQGDSDPIQQFAMDTLAEPLSRVVSDSHRGMISDSPCTGYFAALSSA